MRISPKPVNPPHRCAVNPGITEDRDGFIQTGVVLKAIDPSIEVSVASARALARVIGCATPEEKAEFEGRIAALEQQVEQLEAELKQADYQLNAIDVLKNAGFEAKKRAGRPPNGAKAA